MNKKLPIIRLDLISDQKILFEKLYDIGYRYGIEKATSFEEGWETYLEDAGNTIYLNSIYPFITLEADKTINAYKNHKTYLKPVLMNSIRQFVEYTQHLS